jgi:hypothetical protein
MMAYFYEFPENEPQEKPDFHEASRKGDSSAALAWNERAGRRSDQTHNPQEQAEPKKMEDMSEEKKRDFDQAPTEQNLRDWYDKLSSVEREVLSFTKPYSKLELSSLKEQTERRKVESLGGRSIGRGFNQVPTEKNVRDLYDKLEPELKEALKDPNTYVLLTCRASRTGDAGYNERLTRRSGETTKQILRKLGVKAKIEIDACGYDKSKPEGDDRFDRQVHVDIVPPDMEEPRGTDEFDPKTSKDKIKSPGKFKKNESENVENKKIESISNSIKGKIEKSIYIEVDKITKVYLGSEGKLKYFSQSNTELAGITASLKMIGAECNNGRGPHIQEGKPYSMQELNDRMFLIVDDISLRRLLNENADKNLEHGCMIAANAANMILKQAMTPEERQAALQGFVETILPKLVGRLTTHLEI